MGKLSRQRVAKDARTTLGRNHPLETFFSSYDGFAYNSETPSGLEYQRLRRQFGWRRGDEGGELAWQNFRAALVLEFNARLGTDASDLLAWQTLCATVGIEEARSAKDCNECEKLFKSRFFNLVDVVDALRRGNNELVPTFASAAGLEEHTKMTAAYFPRYHEASGNLLKRVLRRPPRTESLDLVEG